MSSSAGCSSLALHTDDQKESSDDSPACLENPRPAGAESTLTENVASPFQAEPRHCPFRRRSSAGYVPKRRRWMSVGFGIGRIARSFPPRRFQELHHLISILLDAYMQCIYTMIVDITLTLRGQSFEWDAEKAASNFAKHGVAFPEACEVFFDPFFHLDRKSTRLNSSHPSTSYAVFCLKKKIQLLRLSLATPSRWTPLALSVFLHCVVALLLTLL